MSYSEQNQLICHSSWGCTIDECQEGLEEFLCGIILLPGQMDLMETTFMLLLILSIICNASFADTNLPLFWRLREAEK